MVKIIPKYWSIILGLGLLSVLSSHGANDENGGYESDIYEPQCEEEYSYCVNGVCIAIADNKYNWKSARIVCRNPPLGYQKDLVQFENILKFHNTFKQCILKHPEANACFWTLASHDYSITDKTSAYYWNNEKIPDWIDTFHKFDKIGFLYMNTENGNSNFDSTDDPDILCYPVCQYNFTNDEMSTCFTNYGDNVSSTLELTYTEYKLSTVEYDITKDLTTISSDDDASTTSKSVSTIPVNTKTTSPVTVKTTSTVTTKTTKKDENKPEIKYCEPNRFEKFMWPKTISGQIANCSCPDERHTGNVSRKCVKENLDVEPYWENSLKYNCVSEWIDDLLEKAKNKSPDEIYEEWSKHGNQIEYDYGEELLSVLEILKIMNTKVEMAFKSTPKKVENGEKFSNWLTDRSNELLLSKNDRLWETLENVEQQRAGADIMEEMDYLGYTMGCYISKSEDGTSIEKPNIVMQTYNMTSSNQNQTLFPKNKSYHGNQLDLKGNISTLLNSVDYACDGKSAVGVLFPDIGKLLLPKNFKGFEDRQVNSPIIGFSIGRYNNSVNLPPGSSVVLTFKHIKETIGFSNASCHYWDYKNGFFDTNGCKVLEANKTHTVCECNHLTNFAVIMSVKIAPPKNNLIESLTYLCSGVSVLALILTISVLNGFSSLHCRRSTITTNLSVTLLLVNVIVLIGLDRTENNIICSIIAMALHYFLLSTFMWMLMEGIILYQMIVVVFSTILDINMRYFYAIGYGIPLVIVSISASARHDGYGDGNYCWITRKHNLIWSFAGPALVIIVINTFVLAAALNAASTVRRRKLHKNPNMAAGWLKGSFSMMCLLGVTWAVGLFFVDENTEFFAYIFVIFNGLQGLLIFVFHVFLNEKVRTAVLRFYKGKQDLRKTTRLSDVTTRTISGSSYSSNRSSINT